MNNLSIGAQFATSEKENLQFKPDCYDVLKTAQMMAT
jgi:hypothetical protein